jgi:hypothetical protein
VTPLIIVLITSFFMLGFVPDAEAAQFGKTSVALFTAYRVASILLLTRFPAPSSGTLNSITFFVTEVTTGMVNPG